MLGYILKQSELNTILANLRDLFNIRITFYAPEGKELESVESKPDSDYCAARRKESAFLADCLVCDKRNLEKARESKEIIIYVCHAGLFEAVIPLYNGSRYLGAFFLGQIRPSEQKSVRQPNRSLLRLYSGLTEYSQERFQALAQHLKLVSEYVIVKEIIRLKNKDWIEASVEYIQKNINKQIGLKNLVSLTGKSQSFISHFFRKEFGQSPKQYIIKVKLERAGKMIREGSTVKAASAESGFYDEFHFSRLFKKTYGYPPQTMKKG